MADGVLSSKLLFQGKSLSEVIAVRPIQNIFDVSGHADRPAFTPLRQLHRTDTSTWVENKFTILTGSEKRFYTSRRYQLHLLCLIFQYMQRIVFTSSRCCSSVCVLTELVLPISPIFIYQSSARAFVYSGV